MHQRQLPFFIIVICFKSSSVELSFTYNKMLVFVFYAIIIDKPILLEFQVYNVVL